MNKTLIKIGIPSKGRLFEGSLSFLAQNGINLDMDSRHLVKEYKVKDKRYLVSLLRPKDIVKLVDEKVLDFGICGLDTLLENGANVKISTKLGFAKCRVVVAVPESGNIQNLSELSGKTIATSYPKIASSYFEKINIKVNIVTLSGSVETAPRLGLADAIVDIVETGSTLEANGLTPIQQIKTLEAILIAKDNIFAKQFLS